MKSFVLLVLLQHRFADQHSFLLVLKHKNWLFGSFLFQEICANLMIYIFSILTLKILAPLPYSIFISRFTSVLCWVFLENISNFNMKNSILYFETCPCKCIKTFLSVKEGEKTIRRFLYFSVSSSSTHEGLWSYFLKLCGARKFCYRRNIDKIADKLFEILMKIIAFNRPWYMNR